MSGEPWFLADPLPAVGTYVLGGSEGRHAASVRRLRPGEPVVLTDGRGGRADATVMSSGRSELTLEIVGSVQVPGPALRVTLVQALPKGERGDLAVDLATEAGVDALVPWQAQRCVARWDDGKAARGVARWQATAREAAKQSRRAWVPQVSALASTGEVARLVGAADAALILHETGAVPFASAWLPIAGELVLVVGPEGGIAPDELATLVAAGGQEVRLGPEVLRTSTTAAVVLGAIAVRTGRWA